MKLCQYRFTSEPARGQKCETPLIAICDRSKPSQPVEFRGQKWTKKHPQIISMYPEAEEQNNLCFFHQQKEVKDNIGGES